MVARCPLSHYGGVMFRFRLTGLLALLALLAAPAFAETHLVCRTTGAVIVGCPDEQIPEQTVVGETSCCEHRLAASIAPAVSQPQPEPALAPAAIPTVNVCFVPLRSWAPSATTRALREGGPPIFISVRAILI